MKLLVLLRYSALLIALVPANGLFARPGDGVEFRTVAPFNQRTNATWGNVVTDVVQHEAPGDHNSYPDRITLAHETSHGIHAYLRNRMNDMGRPVNAFYVLENRAVIVAEPKMRKSKVAPYVPQSLRGSRYSVYVTGATSWDDRPLYIYDEWVAYTNGGDAGVDMYENGLWGTTRRDAVVGEMEFIPYAIATAMAVEKFDPDYFNNYPQFREFLAWNIERSMKSFQIGRLIPEFKFDTQEKAYNNLRSSADAEAMRAFMRRVYGSDWTLEVLGF